MAKGHFHLAKVCFVCHHLRRKSGSKFFPHSLPFSCLMFGAMAKGMAKGRFVGMAKGRFVCHHLRTKSGGKFFPSKTKVSGSVVFFDEIMIVASGGDWRAAEGMGKPRC